MVKCPYCGREYSDSGIKSHLAETNSIRVGKHGCPYLYSRKEDVIEDYKSMSIEDLSKKYKVRFDQISDSLKFWGVKIDAQNNKRYSNMGKWVPFNTHFFDEEYMDEARYWLLGMLASDGNVCKNNNRVTISQSGDNGKEIIYYIRDLLQLECEPSCKDTHLNGSYNKDYSIGFSSKDVKRRLSEFNIVPNKTYSYTFPDNIPDKFIPSFICGYLEGDGMIGCYNVGGTKDFCEIIIAGTESFIKECSVKIPFKNRINKCKNSIIWTLSLNGTVAIEFCDWIYESEKIYKGSNKYSNYIRCKESNMNSIRYKSKEDALKLLDFVNKNGSIDVMEYYKQHPEHHFQNYYKWLHDFELQGLITENQYKNQQKDRRSNKTIEIETKMKQLIDSDNFISVTKFVNDLGYNDRRTKQLCYKILKKFVSDGHISEEKRKSFIGGYKYE